MFDANEYFFDNCVNYPFNKTQLLTESVEHAVAAVRCVVLVTDSNKKPIYVRSEGYTRVVG